MTVFFWITLVSVWTGPVQSEPTPQSRIQHYKKAREMLVRYCATQANGSAAQWITAGTHITHGGDKPILVVLIDQGPRSQPLVSDLMKKLTSPQSEIRELAGIRFRIVTHKRPSEKGWADAKEIARYQNARDQLLAYADNEAGSDTDVPLTLLTRGTYVRRDSQRGVKLMVISRTPQDSNLDYSGLSLDDVMRHFTHKSSLLAALQGIHYEIRYLPSSLSSKHFELF